MATVHRIIHEDLNKVCDKFIPRMLNNEQKERYVSDSREIIDGPQNCPSSSLHTKPEFCN